MRTYMILCNLASVFLSLIITGTFETKVNDNIFESLELYVIAAENWLAHTMYLSSFKLQKIRCFYNPIMAPNSR